MRRTLLTAAVTLSLLLCSCSKSSTSGKPHATVVLRDGTSVSGSVLESGASEIKIAGDDNITRVIPMSQVKQVNYDEAPASASGPAPGSAPATASSPTEPVAPASAPPPARAEREPARPRPTEAEVTSRTHEVPAGTEVPVRTDEAIDSATAAEGQTFPAEVTTSVKDAEGNVVIPRGADARIIIRSATKGGKIKGASDLVLDLDSVSIGGRQYQVSTVDLAEKGREGIGVNKRTGEFAGGGAAVGAIIGAIAGGGKGAAIGAGSGAGAGALTQILTKGKSIKIPVESVLTFKLDRRLTVTAR